MDLRTPGSWAKGGPCVQKLSLLAWMAFAYSSPGVHVGWGGRGGEPGPSHLPTAPRPKQPPGTLGTCALPRQLSAGHLRQRVRSEASLPIPVLERPQYEPGRRPKATSRVCTWPGPVGCAPPRDRRAGVTYRRGPRARPQAAVGKGARERDGREGWERPPAWKGGDLGAEREQDLPNASRWGWSARGLAWSPSDFLPPTLLPHLLAHFPASRSRGGGWGSAAPPTEPQGVRPGPGHLGQGRAEAQVSSPHMTRSTCHMLQ